MKCLCCVAALGMWLGAALRVSALCLLAAQLPSLAVAANLSPGPADNVIKIPTYFTFAQVKITKEQETTMASESTETLQGEPWIITSSAFSEMLPDKPALVTFNADTIRLEAPCNIYTTKVQLGAGSIVVFPFENMPRTCGREAMEVEGALLRAFVRVSEFSASVGGELVLRAPDGSEMIRARR